MVLNSLLFRYYHDIGDNRDFPDNLLNRRHNIVKSLTCITGSKYQYFDH